MNDEQAFIRALAEAPLDHGVRLMYADWLLENDRPEEAERERHWVEAYDVIKEYTDEWYNHDYDQNTGDPIPDTFKYDYAKVMAEVMSWKSQIQNHGKATRWGGTIDLCFVTNHAQDKLGESAENRAAFWRAFTVLTGIEPPADLREQEWYSCAC